MNIKTDDLLLKLLYSSMGLILLFVLIENFNRSWSSLLLCGLLIFSVTVRNAVIKTSASHNNLCIISSFFDILLISLILYLSSGNVTALFYGIIICESVLSYRVATSFSLTLMSFAAYLSIKYVKANFTIINFSSELITALILFSACYVMSFIAKYEISQRKKLNETMIELKIKSNQLENTYNQLKKASKQLEELTIMKERNRIAREIHDTVGHTLTSVLIEMEAAQKLLDIDKSSAEEKLGLAKEQVRKGLTDVRMSVRTLKQGNEILDFVPSLESLINDYIKHTSVNIKYMISPDLPKLNEAQEKTLYRALQEGLTNGVKHGKSTAFVFILDYEDNIVKFSLQDNGCGTDDVNYSFGLTSMNDRVSEIGGTMIVHSSKDDGFLIEITVPIDRRN